LRFSCSFVIVVAAVDVVGGGGRAATQNRLVASPLLLLFAIYETHPERFIIMALLVALLLLLSLFVMGQCLEGAHWLACKAVVDSSGTSRKRRFVVVVVVIAGRLKYENFMQFLYSFRSLASHSLSLTLTHSLAANIMHIRE